MFIGLHNVIRATALAFALSGGMVLGVIILMVCASILGRTATTLLYSGFVQGNFPGLAQVMLSTGIGPIKGDYEILEAAMPFVLFGFLAFCPVSAGHATVDIFTDRLQFLARRVLAMLIEVVFAVVLLVITVQMYDGMQTMMRRNSLTFILQFPLWWAYAAAMVPAVVVSVVGVWMALVRVAEAALNRSLIPEPAGADH
jgi:TRAP-type C4-dicarboxylate transport system permease small subunit